jgi:phosphoribosylaminoimidazole carboxylase (NCAIR synthetase)
MGIQADPMQSREHILLSTILENAWSAGQDMDLAALIQRIQQPPVQRVGVMEVETFFPFQGSVRVGDAAEQPHRIAGFFALDGGGAAGHQRHALHTAGQDRG